MKLLIFCGLLGLVAAIDPALPKQNFTTELATLRQQSKALHDEANAQLTKLISSGHHHLIDGLTFQIGLLWNYNYDLEHSPAQLTLVELNLLREGLLHRQNRVAEELAILKNILENSSTKPTINEMRIKINYLVLWEKELAKTNYTNSIYEFAMKNEVKHLPGLQATLSQNNLTETQLGTVRQSFERLVLALEGLEKIRVYAADVKIAYYN